MTAITPITITPDHIAHPDYYSKLDKNKLIFATTNAEDKKKVICSISHNELEIGSTCYKVNCCKQVFSSAVKPWFYKNSTCPLCRKELKITDSFTTTELIKYKLSSIGKKVLLMGAGAAFAYLIPSMSSSYKISLIDLVMVSSGAILSILTSNNKTFLITGIGIGSSLYSELEADNLTLATTALSASLIFLSLIFCQKRLGYFNERTFVGRFITSQILTLGGLVTFLSTNMIIKIAEKITQSSFSLGSGTLAALEGAAITLLPNF